MNVCHWVIFKLNWNKLHAHLTLYYISEHMNTHVLYKGSNMSILKFEKVFQLSSVSQFISGAMFTSN